MPAIRLRSVQNTLRSACDPHADQPSIRLRSVAITLLLSPLIPRADRSPALGRWARRFGDPKKGRDARGVKGPRSRHARSNAENGAARPRIIHRSPEARNRLRAPRRQGLVPPGRFPQLRHVLAYGRKRLIAQFNSYRQPICPNHVASFGGSISRAGANQDPTVLKQTTRARRPAAKPGSIAMFGWAAWQKDLGGVPVGSKPPAAWIIDVPSQFRGGLQKIWRSAPRKPC